MPVDAVTRSPDTSPPTGARYVDAHPVGLPGRDGRAVSRGVEPDADGDHAEQHQGNRQDGRRAPSQPLPPRRTPRSAGSRRAHASLSRRIAGSRTLPRLLCVCEAAVQGRFDEHRDEQRILIRSGHRPVTAGRRPPNLAGMLTEIRPAARISCLGYVGVGLRNRRGGGQRAARGCSSCGRAVRGGVRGREVGGVRLARHRSTIRDHDPVPDLHVRWRWRCRAGCHRPDRCGWPRPPPSVAMVPSPSCSCC